MFLIIFSIALLVANIYCFAAKKYTYLFFPCMLFLPEYYGLELSGTLPVITVSRVMFIIFYVYSFINRKRNISIKNSIQELPKTYLFLLGYFIFRITSNIYYIATYSQAITTIFSLVFEQFGLLIAIYLLQPDHEETVKIIKSVVYSSAALFIIGIFESYSRIRPFDELYTVNRSMLNDHYVRLGLYRATTTLGLPVLYGNMCILVLPLILYLYRNSKERRYLFILLLDFFATVHSGSRSDIMFFIAIIVLYFVTQLIFKNDVVLFLKNTVIICIVALVIMTTLSLSNQHSRYFYEGTTKSVLNEFGFSFDIEESAPEGTEGFGTNKHGVTSRTFQLTGIQYALDKNPVFGLGTGALSNGQVYYNTEYGWLVYYTYDMGIVEVLISEGILGFLGYLSLFIFLGIIVFQGFPKLRAYPHEAAITITPFVYLLSTLSTANMNGFLIFIVLMCILLFNKH